MKEKIMKNAIKLFLIGTILSLCACQPVSPSCTEESLTYRQPGMPAGEAMVETSPPELEINGRWIQFDQVIHGPLCNNQLSGKVYIDCDIEIAAWEEKPNFLDDCDFDVEAGSQVYVAAHNNAVYFQGCDFCHVTKEE